MLKAKLAVIAGFLLIFTACEEITNTEYVNEQSVICWVREYEYYDKQVNNIYISGVVVANPIPEFNNLNINDQIFNSPDNYTIYPGYADFGLTSANIDTLIVDDEINFSLSTDFGTVSGLEKSPTPIDSIKINGILVDINSYPEATISLNEELLLSWNYGDIKPDFIRISGWYDYYDGQNYDYIMIDEYIPNTQNSIILFEEGEISYLDSYLYFDIEIFNGPKPDGTGNLSGSGSGSLFWSFTKEDYDVDVEIIGSKSRIDPEVKKEKLDKLRESFLDQFK